MPGHCGGAELWGPTDAAAAEVPLNSTVTRQFPSEARRTFPRTSSPGWGCCHVLGIRRTLRNLRFRRRRFPGFHPGAGLMLLEVGRGAVHVARQHSLVAGHHGVCLKETVNK